MTARRSMRAPDAEVDAFLAAFVDAFDQLDLDRFLRLWAEDATVFHPMPELAHRRSGTELRDAWRQVFAGIRDRSPGPPYLDLRPQDLDVADLGDRARLVTFHLRIGDVLARRTMVLVRGPGGAWEIAHLHASNVRPA